MNALNINVLSPCQQEWNDMHDTVQGKFCAQCAKQVIDFTWMSDEELTKFFKKNSASSLCGWLAADQLNRSLYNRKLQKNNKWYWPVAPLMLLLFGKSSAAQSTTGIIMVTEKPLNNPSSKNNYNLIKKAISVKVVSAQGLGIDGAVIHLSNSVKTLITNKDGSLVFLINEDVRRVTITHPSYFTKEIILSDKIHYVLQMVLKAAKPICPPVMMGKILVQKTN